MKKTFLGLLVLTLPALALKAQSNAPMAKSLSLQKGNVEIFSDQAEFDLKSNQAVYRNNVRVEQPDMWLTCELLTATLPQKGGRIESIVAERSVVFDLKDEKGQTVHGTGDKAIYTFKTGETGTNETIELTGNPVLETGQGSLTGDVIIYDRVTGKLTATHQKMVVRPEAASATNATTESTASTAVTNSGASTNQPASQ